MTKSHSSYPSVLLDAPSTLEELLELLDDSERLSALTDYLLSPKRPRSRLAALDESVHFLTPLDRLVYSAIMRLAHENRYDEQMQVLYLHVIHRGIVLVQFALQGLPWKSCHSILTPIVGRDQ